MDNLTPDLFAWGIIILWGPMLGIVGLVKWWQERRAQTHRSGLPASADSELSSKG